MQVVERNIYGDDMEIERSQMQSAAAVAKALGHALGVVCSGSG